MKINKNTAILTPRTLLVPYSPHHVPTYHTWMQSPTLQQLTASEPLSLEEEYAMQKSWRDDGDKLTFIICTRPPESASNANEKQQLDSNVHEHEYNADADSLQITPGLQDAPQNMVGDVNLFLVEDSSSEIQETEQHQQQPSPPTPQTPLIGELEIMIASPLHRGHGLARLSLLAFLSYIATSLPAILAEYEYAAASNGSARRAGYTLRYFRVKIAQENKKSIQLFASVGFEMVGGGVANFFGEVEMRLLAGKEGDWGAGVRGRQVRYGGV